MGKGDPFNHEYDPGIKGQSFKEIFEEIKHDMEREVREEEVAEEI